MAAERDDIVAMGTGDKWEGVLFGRNCGQRFPRIFRWKRNLPFEFMNGLERGVVAWLFIRTTLVVVERKTRRKAILLVKNQSFQPCHFRVLQFTQKDSKKRNCHSRIS